MKIYKSLVEESTKQNEAIQLIDNELSLGDKINNVISSYEDLKLNRTLFSDLIRELFNKLHYKVYYPRVGDVNERFDLLLEAENSKIVVEVEIPSLAVLDAPRDLLDDIAVMVNRRNENKENIKGLVLCWDLPNNRTDYWNVINDINNVLGIKIYTINVISLLILYWTNNSFDLNDNYFLNAETKDFINIIGILKENGLIESDFMGYFSPAK